MPSRFFSGGSTMVYEEGVSERDELLDDQDELLLEESEAWVNPSTGVFVPELVFSSRAGLICRSDPSYCVNKEDLVGVDRKDNLLTYTAYRLEKYGCFNDTHLVRHVVVIAAANKGTKEENTALVDRWYDAALHSLGRTREGMKKPLLVFINPVSGPRISVGMWNTLCKNIIVRDAGHCIEEVTTKYRGHALDIVREETDLVAKYKGIIIVSGDGLMNEVIQGIMGRSDWARTIREIPIGILPAGSGNGLARTLCEEASLPYSPTSAAVIIAKGNTRALDVAAIDIYNCETPDSPHKRMYSFLSMAWALIADVDIESEYLRPLGGARFTIGAIQRWLFLRKYRGRISYLPAVKGTAKPRNAREENVPKTALYWDIHDRLHELDNTKPPETVLVPKPTEDVPSDWIQVEDTFWSMWNCNIAWMSGKDCIAPDASFSDGYIQLQYLRENGPSKLTKWKLLKYLLGFSSAAHRKSRYVEMAPTRAYRFEPLQGPNVRNKGIIAIDGESVEYTSLQMESLCGFMKIYGP